MKTTTTQEVINLLAWYNLGKLPDNEQTMVDNAIKEDASLKEQLLIEQSMATLLKKDKTLLDESLFENSQSRLEGVLAKIDLLEDTQIAPTTTSKSSISPEQKLSFFTQLKTKFDELLTGSSHSFTYAVFAALTVVQLGLLVFFIVPSVNVEDSSDFYTASATSTTLDQPVRNASSSQSGTTFILGIEGNITLDDTTSLSSDVKIDLLPSDSGYYRLHVSKQLSAIEFQELKNELSKKHGAIYFFGEETTF